MMMLRGGPPPPPKKKRLRVNDVAKAAEGGEKVLGVSIGEDSGCAPLVVGV